MKGNVIQMNTLHLNSVRLNGIGKVQSVSLKGGSTEDPVFPPVEPPIEPEPTPTYTLSASVTNGMVSAKRNGSAVNLPYTANEGDTIVLEVTPNDGYAFEGWNDGNTDNPRSITMTADVVLSAQCVEVVQPPVGKYIQFEDPAVEAICLANWSSDGIGLTEEDAAAVTSIGNVFSQNKEITSFNEFEHFTGVTSIRADWDNSISSYKGAFADCSNLRTIKLPASLVTLGQYSFYKCTSLTVDITDMLLNISVIGQYAFYNCPITGKVVMPNVSYIDRAQFYQTNISEVADMGKVTKLLGAQTGPFYNCDLMESITLPDTMTSIDGGSLYYCDRLTRIISRATTPPTITDWSFKGANIEVIYVPDASLEAYKTALNWNTYADRIHPLSEIEGSLVFYDKLVGDGFAHINTEYYPKGTDSFAWDAERPRYYNKFIFGSKSSAFNVGALASNEMQTYYLVGSTGATAVSEDNSQRFVRSMQVLAIDGSLHRVLTDNGVQTKDFGVVGSYADKTSSSPIYLFACQLNASAATPDRIYQGVIRYFIITDIDGNTIISLKPCTWNGEAGMWDEVNGKFYGNAATRGEFSVAND